MTAFVNYLFQLPGLIILGLFSLVIGTTVLALIVFFVMGIGRGRAKSSKKSSGRHH
jgi:hypothetical protein